MKTKRGVVSTQRRSLLGVALLVVVAGATHALLVSCGGSKTSETTNTEQNTPTTGTTPTPAPTDTSMTASAGTGDAVAGEKIYKLRCTPCHGPQGKGDGPLGKSLNPKPRDHTDAAYMHSRTDAELIGVITNGKGAMPAWGKTGVLSAKDILDALAYVRTLAK